MADEPKTRKAGFHFSRVGGQVTLTAGGDIVAGDKTTATTIQLGFAAESNKEQFHHHIDQLREALRAVQAALEASPSLSADQKHAAASEIRPHVKALKAVKERTADLPAGKPAPAEVASVVETTLKRAGSVMDLLQNLAQKTVAMTGTVGEFAAKYGPLLASARHLFGLP